MQNQRKSMHIIPRPFIRSIDAGGRLEVFLVTAIITILAIRLFLHLTGYPQLGGGGLHIAHVLLGVFMMVAIVILLAFLDKHSADLAALLGGFGFGAFIDELGKFITSDSDYFFQPTIALIYIMFILLYLSFQAIVEHSRLSLSPQEKIINVIEITKDAVIDEMDIQERHRALELLDECNPADPLVGALRDVLKGIDSVPAPDPSLYARAKGQMGNLYARLVEMTWFVKAVIALFVLQSLATLSVAIALVLSKTQQVSLPMFEGLAVAASVLAAVIVLAGVLRIRRDRLAAYQLFKNAILIQIFLVQVFIFYQDQLLAVSGLAGNILTLAVLRYVISQEKATAARHASGSEPPN